MTVTVEQLQAELAGLKSENEKLKASQQDAAVADLKGKLDAAAAAKAAADDLLQKANDALTALRTQAAEQAAAAEALKAQLDEAAKSLAESQAELKTLYAEKTTLARVATAKDKLKFTDEQAAEFVEANATLNDEQFGKQVEVLTKAMTAWVTNNPQPGNTAFSGPAGKTPPKATDKPTAPKATDKPAPNKASEADAAGEEAAAATDLDAATAAAEPALSAAVTDSGVSELQKLIASALGYKDEPAAE